MIRLAYLIAAVIFGFAMNTYFDQRQQEVSQYAPQAHARHKKPEACVAPAPCTEPPAACFVHGGAPVNVQCFSD